MPLTTANTKFRRLTERKNLPRDVRRFERAINGRLSKHFGVDNKLIVVRVPGRLDVMGGIADYSGAVVCEGTLGRAVVLGLQQRQDNEINIYSDGIESDFEPSFRMRLDDFYTLGPRHSPRAKLKSYNKVKAFFKQEPKTEWAGYIAGAFFVLLAEKVVQDFKSGANIVLQSTVPMGAGISSSAAIEIATIHALNIAFKLNIEPLRMAELAQMVENKVVGAPCGIMDQVVTTFGRTNHFIPIRCQPCDVLGTVALPNGCSAIGINSNVKHAVGGSKYTDVRIGTFMGHKIIVAHLQKSKQLSPAIKRHLCNIPPKDFAHRYAAMLPATIKGSDFLKIFGNTFDSVTEIEPEKVYKVRSRAAHAIYENWRVNQFLECIERASETGEERHLIRAGKLMYASHWSYRNRCGLDSPETNLLVKLARGIGVENGIFGAKITGGGSGGTVAILGLKDRMKENADKITAAYEAKRGIKSEVFSDSSPGAVEFGHIEYEVI